MHPALMVIMALGLLLGTTLALSTSHWLIAWMGLEINTIAILPLLANKFHPRSIEATVKYFLVQAAAASVLLFAVITNAWLTGEWSVELTPHPIASNLMILAFAVKLGLAPLHLWMPEVLQALDLTTGLILATWQKLAPFALLLYLAPSKSGLLIGLGLASALIGGCGGLNQTQLRKLLAYSSIAHFGWMVLIMQFSPALSMMTFFLYLLMTAAAFLTFKMARATTINQLALSSSKYPILTALTPLTLLSLAGLPPLTGFAPKWLIVQELVKQGLPVVATLAIMSALFSLYFYLRLAYAMAMTLPPNTMAGIPHWRLLPPNASLPLAAFTAATLFLLPLTPGLLALMTP
uniref:NADH-ubiquinone oxidoreductase chain 2 n=1 Tax=Pempheris schwenkii TaxID=463600 RepID=A0A0B6VJT3_9TELE|nr:NADH dehydrogenase subunit 2 [Pempheris schwenkii]BAQ20943.1 NADH dehydrogenase subunit 2 [Pempheris schwenkii]